MRPQIKKNKISVNTFILIAGAILAQIITFIATPVLTRVYAPNDFGVYSLYVAIVSVFGVIATGRYEFAIILPEKDDDAKILLKISILMALVVSSVIAFVLMLFKGEVLNLLGTSGLSDWLYFVPISVFLMGVSQALTSWNSRNKFFHLNSISRVSQSATQCLVQLLFGYLFKSLGLIYGQIIGTCASIMTMMSDTNNKQILGSKFDKKFAKDQLLKYKKIPMYGVIGAFSDTLALQMPILIITKYYSDTITGLFGLSYRVLCIPAGIISSALAQVLFQKIVEINREDSRNLKYLIIKLFLVLFALYLPLIPVLMFFGEDLFEWVFGYQWRNAGTYAGYLSLVVAVRFAVSPLSVVLGLEKNIKMGMNWQVLYLFTVSICLLFFSRFSFETFLVALVFHEIILYSIYMALILKGANSNTRNDITNRC